MSINEMSSHQELVLEIEETREQLGDTIEELAHRLDVKARAEDKIAQVRENAQSTLADFGQTIAHGGAVVREQAHRIGPRRGTPLAALGFALVLVVVLVRRAR
jgi:hypothetical protein